MPLRRFTLAQRIAALISMAIAAMVLAAAPVLANATEAEPHAMTMMAMPDAMDAPCAGKMDHPVNSPDKHAGNCLAICLAAHGAILSETPPLQGAWATPPEPVRSFFEIGRAHV